MQRNYWVARLGSGNMYATAAYEKGIIALGWDDTEDLNQYKDLDQKNFTGVIGGKLKNFLEGKSEKSIFSSAAQLYKFVSVMKSGDIVLSPANTEGACYVGIIQSDYYFSNVNDDLPYRHRRNVEWIKTLDKRSFTDKLRNTYGSILTIFNISQHADEIENLISNTQAVVQGEAIENTADFGLEAHLEEFLVYNWESLDVAKDYKIYEEEGEKVGQQYPIDIGRIDILARRRDDKGWLVIELKKGRSGDAVVGQILRYMGYIQKHFVQEGEDVKGLIITGQNDKNIQYAISQIPNIDFLNYKVKFELQKQNLLD